MRVAALMGLVLLVVCGRPESPVAPSAELPIAGQWTGTFVLSNCQARPVADSLGARHLQRSRLCPSRQWVCPSDVRCEGRPDYPHTSWWIVVQDTETPLVLLLEPRFGSDR